MAEGREEGLVLASASLSAASAAQPGEDKQ